MNTQSIPKNTVSYEEFLIEKLRDPQMAQLYRMASWEAFLEDNDIEALMFAHECLERAQYLANFPPPPTNSNIPNGAIICEPEDDFDPWAEPTRTGLLDQIDPSELITFRVTPGANSAKTPASG